MFENLNGKKFFVMFLAVMMLTSLFAVSAFAEEEETQPAIIFQGDDGDLLAWWMEDEAMVEEEVVGADLIEAGWEVKGVVDADGDGHPDIYLYNRDEGKVEIWLMEGLEHVDTVEVTNPAEDKETIDSVWDMMAVADLDGSGEPDIIWQALEGPNEGHLAVWMMEDQAAYETSRIYNVPGQPYVDPNWEIGSIYDLLGDDEPEVIWQAVGGAHEDQLAYWKLDMETFERVDSARIYNHPGDPTFIADWRLNASVDLFGDDIEEFLFHNIDGRLAYWQLDVDDPEEVIRKDSGPLDPNEIGEDYLLVGAADFVVEVEPELYSVTFEVTDEDEEAIEDADVALNDYEEATDEDGMAAFEVAPGEYDYTVTKDGYEDATGTVAVVDEDVTEEVTLEAVVEPLEVVSVEPIDDIEVALGTPFEELDLPEEVEVTLDNDEETTRDLEVDWAAAEEDYDADEAGVYELEGELVLPEDVINPDEHVAEVNVIVLPDSGVAGFIFEKNNNGSLADRAVEEANVAVDGYDAMTDEDGFFHIEAVGAGEYDITVSKDGYTPVEDEITVKEGEFSAYVLYNFASIAQSGITIENFVRDSDSHDTIDNFTWTLDLYCDEDDEWTEVTTTEASSTIKYKNDGEDVDFGDLVRVTVEKPFYENPEGAYHPFEKEFNLKSVETENKVEEDGIFLDAVEELDIDGVVYDPDEVGVEGATTTLHYVDEDEEYELGDVTTTEEGKYEFAGKTLPTGDYLIKVDDGESARKHAEVSVEEGVNKERDIYLVAGSELTFNLSTDTGYFATSTDSTTTLQLMKQGAEVHSTSTVPEDEKDTLGFTLDRVAPGDYDVVASGRYVVETSYSITMPGENATHGGIIETAGYVSGKITGLDKVPDSTSTLAEATVYLLKDEVEVRDTETENDGTYEFKGVAAGEGYNVKAEKEGYIAKERDAAAFEIERLEDNVEKDIELRSVSATKVSGKVTYGGPLGVLGGGPVAGAKITYYYTEDDANDAYEAGDVATYATTTNEGKYEIKDQAPGTYKVVLRNPGESETKDAEITIGDGQVIENEHYDLKRTEGATLTIEFDQDQNVTEATTTALDEHYEHEEFEAYADPKDGYYSTTTVTDNEQELKQLPPGTYSVKVEVDGYLDEEFEVTMGTADETVEISLTEEPDDYKVEFRVLDQVAAGLENALIAVYDADDELVDEKYIKTGSDGYAYIDLPDGEYKAVVFAEDFLSESVEFAVDGDDERVPNITLTPQ